MESTKHKKHLKRWTILALAQYYSKAMGFIYFAMIIGLGGAETAGYYYPVYLTYIMVVSFYYQGYGMLLLERGQGLPPQVCTLRVNDKSVSAILWGTVLSTVAGYLVVTQGIRDYLVPMALLFPILYFYKEISRYRSELLLQKQDLKASLIWVLDSTLRVVASFGMGTLMRWQMTRIAVGLSGSVLFSVTVTYLFARSLRKNNGKGTSAALELSGQDLLNMLGYVSAVLWIPLMGWVDHTVLAMQIGERASTVYMGQLGFVYTLISGLGVGISAYVVVRLTDKVKVIERRLMWWLVLVGTCLMAIFNTWSSVGIRVLTPMILLIPVFLYITIQFYSLAIQGKHRSGLRMMVLIPIAKGVCLISLLKATDMPFGWAVPISAGISFATGIATLKKRSA